MSIFVATNKISDSLGTLDYSTLPSLDCSTKTLSFEGSTKPTLSIQDYEAISTIESLGETFFCLDYKKIQTLENRVSPIQTISPFYEEVHLEDSFIKQATTDFSFDRKGQIIAAETDLSNRLFLFGQHDNRFSVKIYPQKTEQVVALKISDEKTYYVKLEELAERLHIPLEELIKAHLDNRLDTYIESQKRPIQTLSLVLEEFGKITGLSDEEHQNILRSDRMKAQVMKTIKIAFNSLIEDDRYVCLNPDFVSKEVEMACSTDSMESQSDIRVNDFLIMKKQGKICILYVQNEILGEGQFGIVKKVWDVTRGIFFALKADKEGSFNTIEEAHLFEKIEQKRRDLSIKNLTGIIPSPEKVFAYLTTTGQQVQHALLFPYFDAGNLFDAIRSNLLSLKQKIDIYHSLVSTINNLKLLKLSHNDIKTENIYLKRNGDSFEVAIGDFGSAKFFEDIQNLQPSTPAYNLTSDQIALTKAIKSKNQPLIADLSHTKDLFCLGACLFELFAGNLLSHVVKDICHEKEKDFISSSFGFDLANIEVANPDFVNYPEIRKYLEKEQTPHFIIDDIISMIYRD